MSLLSVTDGGADPNYRKASGLKVYLIDFILKYYNDFLLSHGGGES